MCTCSKTNEIPVCPQTGEDLDRVVQIIKCKIFFDIMTASGGRAECRAINLRLPPLPEMPTE
jgi:hypothetical protein